MADGDYDFRRTWPVNPDADASSPEAKAPHVDNGVGLITKERFYSPEWARREWNRMWTRVWLWAGREEDAADAGDFFTFELGRESFLIVRGHDGVLRAFYNVCPHRGSRLVSADCGSLRNHLTCPFHSWRFGFDGALQAITDEETFRPEVVSARPGLSQVRCEAWEGFLFINMDQGAKPLLDQIGPMADHARPYNLKNMRIVRRTQSTWDANWKIGVDGFNEAYHVHAIHPQILPIFDDYHAQIDLYPNGMSRMVTTFAVESPRGRRGGGLNDGLKAILAEAGVDPQTFAGEPEDVRTAVQQAKRKRAEEIGLDYSGLIDNQLTDDWNYFIFPNVQMGIHPEGVSFLYFRPHATDPKKFIFDVMVMVHPSDDPVIRPPAYMGLPDGWDISGRETAEIVKVDPREGGLGQLFDQDSSLFPLVQSGVESRGYRGTLLSEQEQRVRHFHTELDRYVLDPSSSP